MAVNEIQEWTFADERGYDQQVKGLHYQGDFGVWFFILSIFLRCRCSARRAEPKADGREGLKS